MSWCCLYSIVTTVSTTASNVSHRCSSRRSRNRRTATAKPKQNKMSAQQRMLAGQMRQLQTVHCGAAATTTIVPHKHQYLCQVAAAGSLRLSGPQRPLPRWCRVDTSHGRGAAGAAIQQQVQQVKPSNDIRQPPSSALASTTAGGAGSTPRMRAGK